MGLGAGDDGADVIPSQIIGISARGVNDGSPATGMSRRVPVVAVRTPQAKPRRVGPSPSEGRRVLRTAR